LVSHSQIACGFFSFYIANAKATHEDASNPIMSSEMNLSIGRVPTAQNQEQFVCKNMWFLCTCVRWREAKRPTKLTALWNHHEALWNKRYLKVF